MVVPVLVIVGIVFLVFAVVFFMLSETRPKFDGVFGALFVLCVMGAIASFITSGSLYDMHRESTHDAIFRKDCLAVHGVPYTSGSERNNKCLK